MFLDALCAKLTVDNKGTKHILLNLCMTHDALIISHYMLLYLINNEEQVSSAMATSCVKVSVPLP